MVIMSGCLGLVRTLSTLCPVSRVPTASPHRAPPAGRAGSLRVMRFWPDRRTVPPWERGRGHADNGADCAPQAVRPDWPTRTPVAGGCVRAAASPGHSAVRDPGTPVFLPGPAIAARPGTVVISGPFRVMRGVLTCDHERL